MRGVRLIAIVLFVLAAVELVLAVELVDQGIAVDDRFRIFLVGWLETQLWVDLRLLGAAVALAVTSRQGERAVP